MEEYVDQGRHSTKPLPRLQGSEAWEQVAKPLPVAPSQPLLTVPPSLPVASWMACSTSLSPRS